MSRFPAADSSGGNRSRRRAAKAFGKGTHGGLRTAVAESSDHTPFWNVADASGPIIAGDNSLVPGPSVIGTGSRLRGQSSSQRESALSLVSTNESIHSHAHASSEEDVHISLGIQSGIERVWHAALERVGSLSLAWQSEGLQTRGGTSSAVDPSLIFGSSLAQKHMSTNEKASNDHHRIRRRARRSRAVVRPRSTTHTSNGSSNNTVRSDEHAPLRRQELDSRREAMLQSMAQDGGFSDHVAETRRVKDRRATMSRQHRRSRRAERLRRPPMLDLPVAEISGPVNNISVQVQAPTLQSDRSDRDTSVPGRFRRRPRTSIRLERLLPPKTPNSPNKIRTVSLPRDSAANSMVATLTGSPLSRRLQIPTQSARKYSDAGFRAPVDMFSAADGLRSISCLASTHRRAKSLPDAPRVYETVRSQGGMDRHMHRGGGALEAASDVKSLLPSSRGNAIQGDSCLSSLEDRVSGMFTELGLQSPYIEVSGIGRDANRYVDGHSNHDDRGGFSSKTRGHSKHPRYHEMEPVPWFYQTQYAIDSIRRGAIERDVLLVDDDSSCADYADSVQDYQNQLYAAKFSRSIGDNGGGGGGSSSRAPRGLELNPHRRLTGTSGLSTVDGSIASTAFDNSQQHRPPFSPRNCSSRRPGASVYGSMPNECRSCSDQKQPCSQMHNILARIEQTDQYIYSISRNASAVDSLLADLRSQSRSLAEILSISQTRASALGHTVAQSMNFAFPAPTVAGTAGSTRCAESVTSFGSSRGNSNSLRDYHLLSKKAHDLHKRHAQILDTQHCASDSDHGLLAARQKTGRNASVRDPSESPRHVAATTRSSKRDKRSDTSRQRRPEQPIPVRIQRIDKQWCELRAVITQLGLESADGNKTTHNAAVVTAEGLKLIQRVLKTTLDSLGAAQATATLESVEQQHL